MVFFITVLRALATCLITNAHYTGIYPTDLIGHFPINWIVLTSAILAVAFVLHKVCELIYVGVDTLAKKIHGGGYDL